MNKQTNGRFDELYGKEYDTIVRLTCPHYGKLQRTVLDSIMRFMLMEYPRAGIYLLELGVGTGETTKRILETGSLITVVAVDNCHEMLEVARRNLAGAISEWRVNLVQADALEYLKTVHSGFFEIFASAFTLHNFDAGYRYEVLKEIHRTLKPGALFVNADKYAHDDARQHNETLQWQLSLTEKKFDEIRRPDLKKAALEHFRQDNRRRRLMREGKSKREMARLGFENIKTTYREKMEATVQAIKR